MRAAWLLILLAAPGFAAAQAPVVKPRIEVEPQPIKLIGPRATFTLLVYEILGNGEITDRTTEARYSSESPSIAKVDARGRIEAVADGSTRIVVRVGQETKYAEVIVKGTTDPVNWHFENDILPILTRHGCNTSGCHGKAEGQNGFKLSIFGSDVPADYAALTREARGRRLFLPAPEHSLLLRKASGQVPHGGGSRIKPDTADYRTLLDWITAGAPLGAKKAPYVLQVRVEPGTRNMPPAALQQMRVWATWSDGREVDVTHHARFQSNNETLATVDAFGLVTASDLPGEATIMASYANQSATFRVVLPRAKKIVPYPELPTNNAIDTQVWAKLRILQVLPSDLCDDATFARRVYLDIIGTLPTPAETSAFLADPRTDKRARLVDALLERPEYADYWALKWADLLRVDRQALGAKHAQGFHRWIRSQFAANRPLDEFVRDILTAEGPLDEVPAAAFYKAVRKPGEAASHLTQVFLGVRIACAECHHHPFDRWSQTDYLGMQAFFTGLKLEGKDETEAIVASAAGPSTHPRSGEKVHARGLGQPDPGGSATVDPRPLLAGWMTDAQNPYFARNLANRYWAHFLGRGIIEAVDDVRATNPPTNPELLVVLADHLTASKFDVKALIRFITASRVYQLSTKPNDTNERDEQNYSRALLRRVPAEVLLDMVSQATGVPEKFDGLPAGTRAIQLWDSKFSHYFLKTFGRPLRVTACECERGTEPGVAQVLHLLNAPELQARLSHPGGTVAKLVRQHADDGALVDGLYLAFYSRTPTEREKAVALAHMQKRKDQRREAAEDLAWTLMNSLEFVFNH
jgi:hypothetical protein